MISRKNVYTELKSMLVTFLTELAFDAAPILFALYQGDFSTAIMVGLWMAVRRSIVKTILISLFPDFFKNMKTKNVLENIDK